MSWGAANLHQNKVSEIAQSQLQNNAYLRNNNPEY
jgi:hypothetical protein